MKLAENICVGLLLFAAASLSAQVDTSSTQPIPAYGTGAGTGTESTDDRMLTPPPVSGQSYPQAPISQERSNYLRAGLGFSSGL